MSNFEGIATLYFCVAVFTAAATAEHWKDVAKNLTVLNGLHSAAIMMLLLLPMPLFAAVVNAEQKAQRILRAYGDLHTVYERETGQHRQAALAADMRALRLQNDITRMRIAHQ